MRTYHFRKNLFLILFFTTSIAALFLVVPRYNAVSIPAELAEIEIDDQLLRVPNVQIRNLNIPVELATSTEAIRKGLSGRQSLGASDGVLFIFQKPGIYRFWMPDMNFPIDIIWINNGKIVDISENVSTDFDPSKPRFYAPSHPVQYVLEVNAGFASRMRIVVGDQVAFNNINK